MCGIFGYIGNTLPSAEVLNNVATQLRHRGPNAFDIKTFEGAALGHTLLSIIGATEIVQPQESEDGRYVITFNGEIYNYIEILEEDPKLKEICSTRPRSDTVVLLEGLAMYGKAFLSKLNGMFAFAFYDKKEKTALIVRDRLGIKPLYYSNSEQGLCFASESKAVRMLSGKAFEPDLSGFYSYIRFRYCIGDLSFDKNIRQLRPGHLLTISAEGAVHEERWWSNLKAGNGDMGYEEASKKAHELLLDSIRLRMRSDYDFSSFLSGGVDSSLIAAVAKDTKKKLDTYSITFDSEQKFDESIYSKEVSEHIDSLHHGINLDKSEYIENHNTLIQHFSEPMGVPNQVALAILSGEVSKTHRVILSGEGADEVFGGYGRIFLLAHDWNLFQRKNELTPELQSRLVKANGIYNPSSLFELFISRYSYTDSEFALQELSNRFGEFDSEDIESRVMSEFSSVWEQIDADCDTNKILVFFQNMHLPGLLMRLDLSSMYHSIEARVPFLDYRLVEFMNSLPTEYKLRTTADKETLAELVSSEISEVHDVPKVMLKQISENYIPESIIYRKKMGFPIPAHFYNQALEDDTPNYMAWVKSNLDKMLAEAG